MSEILHKIRILQEEKKYSNFWNISYIQGFVLSNFVEISKPEKILEIGTSNGFSTLWLSLKKNESCKIDTIEINKERFNLAKQNFKDLNMKNINFFNLDIFEFLKKSEEKYDLIFLDASHKNYLEIFKIIEENKLVKSNSILIVDNLKTHKKLLDFKMYIQEKYFTHEINLGGGFLIVYF